VWQVIQLLCIAAVVYPYMNSNIKGTVTKKIFFISASIFPIYKKYMNSLLSSIN